MFFKVFIPFRQINSKTYGHEKDNTKGLETVEESKVEPPVDEDAGARDAEAPV